MTDKQITETSERYKEARDYDSLLSHPGFVRLVERVERDSEEAFRLLVTGSPRMDATEERDSVSRIRAMKSILSFPKSVAAKRETFAKRLEEAGIALDRS